MKHLADLEDERRKNTCSASMSAHFSTPPTSTRISTFKPGPARPAGVAGNEMCTFLILNISSLQLIPMHVIAYRSQYGSVNPAAIVGAGILSTAISTGAAILFCKCMDRQSR